MGWALASTPGIKRRVKPEVASALLKLLVGWRQGITRKAGAEVKNYKYARRVDSPGT